MNRAALLVAGIACIVAPASAETLRDAIGSAYDTNPQLAEARARQDALAETTEQARAGARLTAEADGSGGYNRSDYGRGGVGSISASLPIWTGGRVSAAVRAAKGDVAAGAAGLRDTEAAVLETVVGAYANLLYAQQAVDVARADIALLDRPVAEARSRYNLGQATRTDVAQLEAQNASAMATLADAQARRRALPRPTARLSVMNPVRWKIFPRVSRYHPISAPPARRSTPILSSVSSDRQHWPTRRGSDSNAPRDIRASRWGELTAMPEAPGSAAITMAPSPA